MRRRAGVIILLSTLAAACAAAEPPPSTIAAGKTTCEEVVIERVPAGLVMADRTLVPYSRVLLGVESEYEIDAESEASSGFVTVISGGYLDDHLEPYDDLETIGERIVLDREASLLVGSFIDARVLAAVWEEPGLAVPCGIRAVVAIGVSEVRFHEILDALGTRQPGPS